MLMHQGRPLCHCEPNKSLQVAASRISRPLDESPAPALSLRSSRRVPGTGTMTSSAICRLLSVETSSGPWGRAGRGGGGGV